MSREERAAIAQAEIHDQFDQKQQAFLDFVLLQYVSVGVDELDQSKLTPLLRLKYHDSIADAVDDLGRLKESLIFLVVSRSIFINSQLHKL